ncbi:hypothetical protein [Acutalibacter caecimuris]|uniref:hypothetical protein n=1 Tax=Acutalibacter caecimuris TaxID=3093657 RepID=UPI002AC9D352|nr:hypothetical protein [Acutalibacter sp. M00118]
MAPSFDGWAGGRFRSWGRCPQTPDFFVFLVGDFGVGGEWGDFSLLGGLSVAGKRKRETEKRKKKKKKRKKRAGA